MSTANPGATPPSPRLYGRAPRGERVIGAVPQNDGANVTLRAALGSQGVEAVMTIDGATDAAGIREAIEQTGARLQYLPPYSPDLAPVERCWSKLKTALRAAKARTREALEHAIAQALATITVSDAHSWFHHCGYALQ